jgi:hypothetical protein
MPSLPGRERAFVRKRKSERERKREILQSVQRQLDLASGLLERKI